MLLIVHCYGCIFLLLGHLTTAMARSRQLNIELPSLVWVTEPKHTRAVVRVVPFFLPPRQSNSTFTPSREMHRTISSFDVGMQQKCAFGWKLQRKARTTTCLFEPVIQRIRFASLTHSLFVSLAVCPAFGASNATEDKTVFLTRLLTSWT